MKKKIVKYNILSCIIAGVLTVLASTFIYLYSLQKTMDEQAYSQTMLLVHILEKSAEKPETVLFQLKDDVYGRITFVDDSGVVTFDSDYNASELQSHADRQEIVSAEQTGTGTAKRYSSTAKRTTYYCAARVNGKGVVRVGVMASVMAWQVFFSTSPIIFLCLVAIIILCYIISGTTTKKIVANIEQYDTEKGEGQIYDELSHFITKINRQNKIINSQMQSMSREKTKLQNIFLNIKEGIIVCDGMQKIVQTNNEARRIFEIEDDNVQFTAAVRVSQVQKAVQRATCGETVHLSFEYRQRWYQCAVSPNATDEDSGAILIVLDITQQVESEKNRRQFTDNVTHELKTPLTSIVGYSQLITNNMAKPEDVKGFVQIIETNALRLLEMIEDIIKISNLEEGTGFNKTLLSLDKIIEKTASQESVSAHSRNITIETHLEKLKINADESQMYQLAHNLISNAIKYNKNGGKVTVSLKKQGGFAVFKVRDTGIGIPDEHLDKIFERFYVVDKSRNRNISSSGLGLAIVKHIVKAHGGTLNVVSKTGEGSCFTITLPID